jgi:hypothetical protein
MHLIYCERKLKSTVYRTVSLKLSNRHTQEICSHLVGQWLKGVPCGMYWKHPLNFSLNKSHYALHYAHYFIKMYLNTILLFSVDPPDKSCIHIDVHASQCQGMKPRGKRCLFPTCSWSWREISLHYSRTSMEYCRHQMLLLRCIH